MAALRGLRSPLPPDFVWCPSQPAAWSARSQHWYSAGPWAAQLSWLEPGRELRTSRRRHAVSDTRRPLLGHPETRCARSRAGSSGRSVNDAPPPPPEHGQQPHACFLRRAVTSGQDAASAQFDCHVPGGETRHSACACSPLHPLAWISAGGSSGLASLELVQRRREGRFSPLTFVQRM